MDVLDKALIFAVKAHSGATRKYTHSPYILHPMEAAVIAGTMTDDKEIIAAAALHDTVEDTDVTIEEIRAEFGERIAKLVSSETEDKRPDLPPGVSWQIRKEQTLEILKESEDPGVLIMWLSDKLSNIRSFYRAYQSVGDSLWEHFNQRDPEKQAWYYRTIRKYTSQLSDTQAWKEYSKLTDKVFEGVNKDD